MTARELASAVFAAVGLYVALDALLEAGRLGAYFLAEPAELSNTNLIAAAVAPLAGALVLGALTFFGSRGLARIAPSAPLDHHATADDPARLAFVAVGIYFAVSGIAWGLPHAIQQLTSDPENWRDTELQSYALMSVLGISICLGADGLAGGISALRRLGRSRR